MIFCIFQGNYVFINIDKLAYIDSDGLTSVSSYTSNFTTGAAGAIYLSNFQIDVLNVNAIVATKSDSTTGASHGNELISTTAGRIPLFYDYATNTTLSDDYLNGSTIQTKGLDNLYATFTSAALTIDVTDELPALTEGFQYNHAADTLATYTVGGVIIGLPTVEVYINNMNLTPKYTGDVDSLTSTAINNTKDYGTIEIDGLTLTVLSGWIEIAPH